MDRKIGDMRTLMWGAWRCAVAILLVAAALQSLASQTTSGQGISPSVSILLPSNVPSEAVRIVYFMVGPFGGSGGYAEQRAGLRSYEVAGSVKAVRRLLLKQERACTSCCATPRLGIPSPIISNQR